MRRSRRTNGTAALLLLISVGLGAAGDVRERGQPCAQSRGVAFARDRRPIALGSSRRLLQLLLAEAFVLSIAGALLGLLASRLMIGLIPASVADALPVVQEISIDFRVLAFSAALAISTSIVFALIPLITVGRAAPGSTLQEEATRTTPGVRRHRVQAGLVVSTVMLAFVLLIGAGLLIRSFSALMETDAGFNPDGVLTASLVLPRSGYRTAASVRSFHESPSHEQLR